MSVYLSDTGMNVHIYIYIYIYVDTTFANRDLKLLKYKSLDDGNGRGRWLRGWAAGGGWGSGDCVLPGKLCPELGVDRARLLELCSGCGNHTVCGNQHARGGGVWYPAC